MDHWVNVNGELRYRDDPSVSAGLSNLCYGVNTAPLQAIFSGGLARDGKQLGIFPGFSGHYFQRDPTTGKFYVPYTNQIINPFDVLSGKINWFDKYQHSVSTILGSASMVATIAEYNFVFDGKWMGANRGWYSTTWGGNQWTGARSIALRKAGALKVASRGAFWAGTAISGYEFGSAMLSQDYYQAAGALFDIGMSALATYGGPPGLIIGGSYLMLDAFGTFDGPLYSIPNLTPAFSIPDNTFVAPKIIIP